MMKTLAILAALISAPAYASDLAVGDSIALGAGRALGVHTVARVGAGSCAISRFAPRGYYDRVVVSAGINDSGQCVAQLRARLHAGRVTWILPAPINQGRLIVSDVAAIYFDRVVSYTCRGGCTKSNFHPADYGTVARWVRMTWANPAAISATSARRPARTGRRHSATRR